MLAALLLFLLVLSAFEAGELPRCSAAAAGTSESASSQVEVDSCFFIRFSGFSHPNLPAPSLGWPPTGQGP